MADVMWCWFLDVDGRLGRRRKSPYVGVDCNIAIPGFPFCCWFLYLNLSHPVSGVLSLFNSL
jgi:hypothetical protein